MAIEPKRPGDPKQRRIGTFPCRYEAEKALEEWLRAHSVASLT